ncbi:MAG: hypothetical protein LIO58_02345 [Oscillospiraceae bacterium]|nr:hypothetical protein [Oscillospiraceae bacterium]
MAFEQVMSAIITAVVGAGGVVGFAFYYLRRYIDRKLQAEEQASDQLVSTRRKRLSVDDKIQHAQGRMFYHLMDNIARIARCLPEAKIPTAQLDEAFQTLTQAEEAKKELNREIIAAYVQDI